MPCIFCTNPALCNPVCRAFEFAPDAVKAQMREACAKIGQMTEQQIAAHVEAGEMPAGQERDWPEDFAHENGMYMNRCSTCGEIFIGYKRRVTCKVCAERMSPATAASPKGEAGEMEAAKGDRR